MTVKKRKAPPARQPVRLHSSVTWWAIGSNVPKFDVPIFVTDGTELAHCVRGHSDRDGDHYFLIDSPNEEFSDVTHFAYEPDLPNGKRPKRST